MQVKTYRLFPYLLIYTDKLPYNSNGCANAFVVRIRNSRKDDLGLEFHEATHARQWWRTLGLHSLLYLISKRYRLKAEVEAYREQLTYRPDCLEKYATWLSLPEPEGYGCQDIVTKGEAIVLLS